MNAPPAPPTRTGLPLPGLDRLRGVTGLVSTVATGDLKRAGPRARLARELGVGVERLVRGRQIHGACLAHVETAPPSGMVSGGQDGADALWTDRPGIGLVTLVADCVPIALCARGGPSTRERAVAIAIAVVHAGWRGAVTGIAGRAAQGLARGANVTLAAIQAVVGPHIGPCCYEVGEEVCTQAVVRPGGVEAVWRSRTPGDAPRLDLGALVRADLLAAGLSPTRVSFLPGCTACEPDRFFSYRKQRTAARFGLALALG